MSDLTKTPTTFWIISVIALLWNAMGCFQWFVEYGYYTKPETREALPEAMRGLYDGQPMWPYIIFAIAVATGLIGSIGLLMKKAWCEQLFLVSLITVIILHGYTLIATDHIQQLGMGSLIMPIIVIIFAAFLIYYAKKYKAAGLLS